MYKIYSRKRFILKPCRNKSEPSKLHRKTFIMKKRTLKIIFLICVLIFIYRTILNYIEPVFETLCEDKVKSMITIISNQESTKTMNKYQYEELYTIEKDEAGNVVIIKSNVVPINNMISDLTEAIQNSINQLENTEIDIPIGNLLGSYYFSGVGPCIPAKVKSSGTLDTEIKSEFIAQGINQTLHRIYVNLECYMKIVTPINNFEKKITNQVIIAEHVIVGNIPDAYYNLEGLDSTDDILNLVK